MRTVDKNIADLLYLRFLLYILFFFIISLGSWASTPIILSDKKDECLFTGKYIDYLEDPHHTLTIYDVSSPLYSKNNFKCGIGTELVINENINSSYWIRLTIINNRTAHLHYVVELFDFKIDSFELYVPDDMGSYSLYKGGDNFPFLNKNYQHKNFVHDLPLSENLPCTIYVKIKASQPVVLIGMIRSYQRLLEYANKEYFLLALFYGVVAAMILFNLFLFFSTLDITYLYYVCYVVSVGFFGLTQDGLGFQYFWPQQPQWNEKMSSISIFFMVIAALLYARNFLNTKRLQPFVDKGILILITFRTILFILSFFMKDIVNLSYINILTLLYLYITSVICWKGGNRTARFYVLAFTLLVIGFSLSALNSMHILSSDPLIVYGFNIGVVCEMVLLSFALADRIKVLTKEKDLAQRQMIVQFKEKEHLKDEINKELEAKVLERTHELENKNKELDTFVYRSSHDIKGPLKSIIGLASVAQLDIKDAQSQYYFEHILKTSKRLDEVVDHLMEVMEIKESTLTISNINFEILLQKILKRFKNHKNFSKIRKEIKVNQLNSFYTDEKLLTPVLESIIENSLKYFDILKMDPFIKISVDAINGKAVLNLSDNGVGIEKKLQDKIFDMFYDLNPEFSTSGIGLYKTKICIDKLQGSLKYRSEEGIGTSFTIGLVNHL